MESAPSITVISASVRAGAQSLQVAEYLSGRLTNLGIPTSVLDLNEKRLPLYDDTKTGSWKPVRNQISTQLRTSDGFVFVSPEWDGMFNVGLHNLFHYLDKELADKPVLLVGVSSGRGGRYPLQQMRIMGYKNKRFVVIPESLYYDHIKTTLVNGTLTDDKIASRTDYALQVLMVYAKALRVVRQSGVIDYDTYPSGL